MPLSPPLLQQRLGQGVPPPRIRPRHRPGPDHAAAAPSAAGATFGGSFVDGGPLLLSSAGNVPFVPGGPPSASLVNLDNLLAQGWRGGDRRSSPHIRRHP